MACFVTLNVGPHVYGKVCRLSWLSLRCGSVVWFNNTESVWSIWHHLWAMYWTASTLLVVAIFSHAVLVLLDTVYQQSLLPCVSLMNVLVVHPYLYDMVLGYLRCHSPFCHQIFCIVTCVLWFQWYYLCWCVQVVLCLEFFAMGFSCVSKKQLSFRAKKIREWVLREEGWVLEQIGSKYRSSDFSLNQQHFIRCQRTWFLAVATLPWQPRSCQQDHGILH